MAAPLFYLIAIGMGAATIGATATDAKKWMGTDKNSAELQTFYNSRFTSPADCLTAAATAKAPVEACALDETAIDNAPQSFNSNDFNSAADCLNAAVSEGAPLQACASKE
jgi:hypothetical protein